MVPRRSWVWLWLLCLGCHALPTLGTAEPPPQAKQLWEQGQAAMQGGQPDVAIRYYEQSLALDPALERNHLSLAAAYLEKKNPGEACLHLARYVEAHPEQLLVRCRYADLLVRVHRLTDAWNELESLIADAQDQDVLAGVDVIPCHSRLVQLAEQTHDGYGEHLNRGIGLYLLARKRRSFADPDGEFPAEGILCKSAAELTLAHKERPDEARPCWYLYAVWTQLGQRQPALCRLREADAAAPFTYLTPSEQRDLYFACQGFLSQTACERR
jgi:tetratricopeptide (TPR) repeat protein